MDSYTPSQIQNPIYLNETDEALLSICGNGDREAFGELTRRYSDLAFRVAFFLLRDEQEARDQVQNAFCKAYQNLSQFRQDAKFSTWLTRIVANQCLMQLRRMKNVRLISIDDLSSHTRDGPSLRDHRRSAQAILENAEEAEILHRAIHRIPALLRNVFLLRYVQQRPMPEVAESLGISIHAAKSRLLRARIELRNRLEQQRYRRGRSAF